jgi:hypothetical protein
MKTKVISLKLSDYENSGLYLTLKDSKRLVLTRDNIEKVTRQFWSSPEKIPPDVKEAVEFQRCSFCPLRGTDDFCDALRPTLPLLDSVDKYSSYDEVSVVYKGEDEEGYHLVDTTMQRALRYISTLSLMAYCQIGRKYWKYFTGIIPTLRPQETANRLYLNIYWIHGGNKDEVDKVISTFVREISTTTDNQMKRLRLICKNDALLNALILTHLITDVLDLSKDKKLKELLAEHRKVEGGI